MEFSVDVSVSESGRKRPEYTLNTDLDGSVTLVDLLEFLQTSLIVTADEVLSEEQAKGFDKNPVILVDGSSSKPLVNVSPLGTIEIVARADMDDIITDTYAGIVGRSPVKTGRYKSSNYVFLNGKQVATDTESLNAWLKTNPDFQDEDIVRFVNIQPYARKLERLGVTADKQVSRSVRRTKSFVVDGQKYSAADGVKLNQPNGVYFLVARSIRAKYKRNSIIKFSFITGENLGISGNFKIGRRGKPGRTYLYPTITISVQESGVT